MPGELYAGIMSGTSLDGVDAALVSFEQAGMRCVTTHYAPYSDSLRREALELHAEGRGELHRAALLANRLADAYGDAVRALLAAAGVEAGAVRAIGCHGQTVRHVPDQCYTVQLNNPARLAELTGIAVIADFRSRDIAAGGQGAPLVPAFHDARFRSTASHRVILNLGGIGNLTDLAPGRPTRGFDCGPGNMLLDAWTQQHLGRPYDADGAWARQGQVLPGLLARLGAHPFLTLPPPKSCGREQFNPAWLESCLAGDEMPVDVQATLVRFTVLTAAEAIRRWCGAPQELLVCGGGAHNRALLDGLGAALPDCRVATTEVLGLPPDWVEAVAFAWLARNHVLGRPGNLPAVTGAAGPRILGAYYPA